MIRTVRAAAYAAAAFAFAALATWGGPLQAWQGESAAVQTYYLDHETADVGVSDLGLNDAGTAPSAEAPAPEANLVEHLVALAGAALPLPRSLGEQVDAFSGLHTVNAEQDCLANAVYFEARGESLEGQLAVAEVVMNRAASGRYPASLCGVVVQQAQFSFVRGGVIPRADRGSEAWRRAVAVARIAEAGLTRLLPRNVLWYHAAYVSPSWGRRLARNAKIGLHVFYS